MSKHIDTQVPRLFTFSPPGSCTKNNARARVKQHIIDIFDIWSRCVEFEANIEFNENGNIHYHGFFVIKDRIAWQHALLYTKTKGFIKINKIKHDFDKAMVYPRKDRAFIKALGIFPDHYIPLTHKSIQKYRTKPVTEYMRKSDQDYQDPLDVLEYIGDPLEWGLGNIDMI